LCACARPYSGTLRRGHGPKFGDFSNLQRATALTRCQQVTPLQNSKRVMHLRKLKTKVLAWAWGKIRKDSLGWGPWTCFVPSQYLVLSLRPFPLGPIAT